MRNKKGRRKGKAKFQQTDTAAWSVRDMGTVTYLGGELGQREVLVGEDSPGVVLGCSAASHSTL